MSNKTAQYSVIGILVIILFLLLMKRSYKSEQDQYVKNVNDSQVNMDNYPVWKDYYKYSLYSNQASPQNKDDYPYIDTAYDKVMNLCTPICSKSTDHKKCLIDCQFKAIESSLKSMNR